MPTLPALAAPRRSGAWWPWLGIWGALLAGAPAEALEVRLSFPRERDGYLYVDAAVRESFGQRVGESLQRGMPATLELRAELWRRRNGWFDRLESGFEARVRIQFEAWNDRYRIERTGVAPI